MQGRVFFRVVNFYVRKGVKIFKLAADPGEFSIQLAFFSYLRKQYAFFGDHNFHLRLWLLLITKIVF